MGDSTLTSASLMGLQDGTTGMEILADNRNNGTTENTIPDEVDNAGKVRNVMIGSVLLVVNTLTLISIIRTKSLRTHTKVSNK